MLEKLIERVSAICTDCYPNEDNVCEMVQMHEQCYNNFVAVTLLKLDLMARFERLPEWGNV